MTRHRGQSPNVTRRQSSEVVMQALADMLPLALTRARKPGRRKAVVRSVEARCETPKLDTCETGPDADPPCDMRGIVVVASVWLAFYVVAAIDQLAATSSP